MPYTSSFEPRVERSDGMIYDVDSHTMVPYHHIDNTYFIDVVFDSKANAYHGDHRTAYNWSHSGGKSTAEKPVIYHDVYDNPTDHLTSNYDIIRSEFLSKHRLPFSTSNVHGPWVSNAVDEAITEAQNSLKGASSQWGNNLGELKTSVESIARDAMRAAAFIRCMRRGKWQEAADALGISLRSFSHSSNRGRALADYWLAYAYGWRPLAQTMHDTQAVMSDIVNRTSKLVEGTGKGRANGSNARTWSGDVLCDGEWTSSTSCTLKATITHPTLFNLSKVGLTNPVSIAWELVPFSFVVDWFLPVTNTLEALSSGFGVDFHGGWYSTITREKFHMFRETGRVDDWTTCLEGGDYHEEVFDFRRVALTAMPHVRFYADLTPWSTPRAVNALALVRQLT